MTLAQSDLQRMYRGNNNLVGMDISGFNKGEQTQIIDFYIDRYTQEKLHIKALEAYLKNLDKSNANLENLLNNPSLSDYKRMVDCHLSWKKLKGIFKSVIYDRFIKKSFEAKELDTLIKYFDILPAKNQRRLLNNSWSIYEIAQSNDELHKVDNFLAKQCLKAYLTAETLELEENWALDEGPEKIALRSMLPELISERVIKILTKYYKSRAGKEDCLVSKTFCFEESTFCFEESKSSDPPVSRYLYPAFNHDTKKLWDQWKEYYPKKFNIEEEFKQIEEAAKEIPVLKMAELPPPPPAPENEWEIDMPAVEKAIKSLKKKNEEEWTL